MIQHEIEIGDKRDEQSFFSQLSYEIYMKSKEKSKTFQSKYYLLSNYIGFHETCIELW